MSNFQGMHTLFFYYAGKQLSQCLGGRPGGRLFLARAPEKVESPAYIMIRPGHRRAVAGGRKEVNRCFR